MNIGNVIFEEKPIIDSDSVLIPINIQDITLVIENNVQTIVDNIVPE